MNSPSKLPPYNLCCALSSDEGIPCFVCNRWLCHPCAQVTHYHYLNGLRMRFCSIAKRGIKWNGEENPLEEFGFMDGGANPVPI